MRRTKGVCWDRINQGKVVMVNLVVVVRTEGLVYTKPSGKKSDDLMPSPTLVMFSSSVPHQL